jgi:hypothetical protein
MSEQEGIIRKQETGNPENPKWNQWWRPVHSESPQVSSDQRHPEEPQQVASGKDGEGSGEPGGDQKEEDQIKLKFGVA